MNTQKLLAVLFVSFLFAISGVLALTITSSVSPQSANSSTVTITNNGAGAVTITVPATTLTDGTHTATVSVTGLTSPLPVGNTTTATISVNGLSTLAYGSYVTNVNATDSLGSQLIPVTFTSSYCKYGDASNGTARQLTITSVKDTSSDTAWKWKPGDSVSLDLKVDYNNDAKTDDKISGVVQIGLFDVTTGKFVDFDNQNDLDKISETFSEGSSNRFTYTLDVPISDIDSSHTYRLMVKVYQDGKESTLCTDKVDNWDSSASNAQSLDLSQQSHEVILKNIAVDSPAPCGQEITLSATAWNIGSNDEDRFYVQAFNKELGINFTTTAIALNQGDSNKLSFSFIIPANARQATYPVYFTTFYDYRKSSDEYLKQSDAYEQDLKVDGCVPPVTASVTAQLNSETPKALIGGQVIVDATVKNTGTASASYSLDVSGNTAWSSLAQIDPKTFTLGAGEEKKVSIYLNVDSTAAAGDQTFTIRTTSGTYSSDKTVQLTLEKGLTSQAIMNNLKQYWYIYVIGVIILILVIAIIIAIVSLAKK